MPRREAPAHALPPDFEGLIDLLVALAVQRYGQEWPQIVATIKTVLVPERGLVDTLPSFPSAARCEERFRVVTQHITGDKIAALPGIIEDLTAKRLQTLAAAHAVTSHEVAELRKVLQMQADAAQAAQAAAAAASADSGAGASSSAAVGGEASSPAMGGDNDEAPADAGAARGTGRTRLAGPAEHVPMDDLEEKWGDLAEEEEKGTRRKADGSSLLLKLLQSVTKHKWAHPFKRPVTDKEAPDYKDIIKNPMDLSTLRKRVESGAVAEVAALVDGLILIFENAMQYNPKSSDYHKMADTLRKQVHAQHEHYKAWKRDADKRKAASPAPAGGEEHAAAEAPQAAAEVKAEAAEPAPAEGGAEAAAEAAAPPPAEPVKEEEAEEEAEEKPAEVVGRGRKRGAAAVAEPPPPAPASTGTGRRKGRKGS